MQEIRVLIKVIKFGKGDIDSLKRFLYTNSGTREDGFKVLSMHQDSENSLDLEVKTSSLDVLPEYSDEYKSDIKVKCIYKDEKSIEYTILG